MRLAANILLGFFIVVTAIWSSLAFFYAGPDALFLRVGVIIIYAGVAVFACIFIWQRKLWYFCLIYLFLLVLMLLWFFSLTPSNARQWQPDVTLLSTITVNDHLVTVHNVRNFDYRSEFDYSPAYYDKVYDLNQLKGADIIAVYWMGPAIAHTLVSFDFGDNNHLAISIETRKEMHESFSSIKGFFRQYELYYVVADERDVIRLRTNYRHNEEVYIYRLSAPISNIRAMFMQYVKEINSLNKQPEFYNSLITNCTTGIWKAMQMNKLQIPFSWQVLASGYLPDYLYEKNALEKHGLSFEALRQRAHINKKAHQLSDSPDFSAKIRQPIIYH